MLTNALGCSRVFLANRLNTRALGVGMKSKETGLRLLALCLWCG